MKVFTTERGEGKSTELLHWLLRGEPIDAWPTWSRVIVVSTAREARLLSFHHQKSEHLGELLLARGGPELDTLILVYDSDLPRRRILDNVEVAVDNVDLLLAHLLHQMPAVVTMTGEPVSLGSTVR